MKTKKMNLIIITAAFATMLGFFGPIDFYYANINDLWYDIYDFLPIICVVTVVFWAALMLVGILLGKNEKALGIYKSILFVSGVCFYIQGNYIKVPYGALNGDTIDWDRYAGDNLKSTLIWIAIIGVMVYVAKKKGMELFEKAGVIVMGCIMLVQLISLMLVGITGDGFVDKSGCKASTESFNKYSSVQNFNILVLDTYDMRVFGDYSLNGHAEETERIFEDFTFFPDTLGGATLTNYAFPHIVGGKHYEGDVSYEEYIENTYSQSAILGELDADGWELNVYTDQPVPQSNDKIGNLREMEYGVSDVGGMINGIYRLVAFKYMPTSLKRYVYYPAEYMQSFYKVEKIDGEAAPEGSSLEFKWDNIELIEKTKDIELVDSKVFHLYHLKGIHALRDTDIDLNVIDNPDEYYSLEEEAGVVNKILGQWMDMLKANGLYDNSVIVIMADHGASTYEAVDNFIQCPLLLIKGVNERHGFEVNQAPVSYDDFSVICDRLLAGETAAQAVTDAINTIEGTKGEWNSAEFGLGKALSELNMDDVGREREIVFHEFTGNLGGEYRGKEGYVLYTRYPAFMGNMIQVRE